jgi:hypothetical protein
MWSKNIYERSACQYFRSAYFFAALPRGHGTCCSNENPYFLQSHRESAAYRGAAALLAGLK